MKAAEIARLRRVYDGRQAPEVAWRYASSRPGVRYLRLRRDRAIRGLLARRGIASLSRLRILDLGCGRGEELTEWQRRGSPPERLAGIDLMEGFARQARAAVPKATVAVASGDELPFADKAVAVEISRWLGHIGAERRMSMKTLDAYRRDVHQFFAFLAEHLGDRVTLAALSHLTPADVRAFMAARRHDGIGGRSQRISKACGALRPAVVRVRPTTISPDHMCATGVPNLGAELSNFSRVTP